MWKIAKLGDVCKIQSGNSIPVKDKEALYSNVNVGLPYVATKDIGFDGVIDYENGVRIPPDHSSKFRLSKKNSILVCGEGGSAGRKIAFSYKDCHFVNKLFSISMGSEMVSKYVYYYTLSNEFQSQFKKAIHGLIGGVSLSKIKGFQITYPSFSEQQRIVTKLDTAFSEIDKSLIATNNNFKNTERLFQNYLTEVFKRSSEDWKNYSIKQLGKVVTGNTPKTSIVENYGDFISFVKPGDFKTDGSIDFEKQKLSKIGASKSRIVGKKSVLMVCIGATIGKCGYTDIDIVTNQQINSITPVSNFNYKFIYYQMLTSEFQNKVMNNYGQTTLPIINKSKWQSLTIKLPNLSEQLKIVKTLDNLRIETDILKKKLLNKTNKLSSLKLSILQQELAGELSQTA